VEPNLQALVLAYASCVVALKQVIVMNNDVISGILKHAHMAKVLSKKKTSKPTLEADSKVPA